MLVIQLVKKLITAVIFGTFLNLLTYLLTLEFDGYFLEFPDRMNSMGPHPMTGLLMLMGPTEDIFPRRVAKSNFHDIRMPLALQVCTSMGLGYHSIFIHMYK